MGKIVLYISTSLDGYIADTSGGVDWLGGEEAGYQGDYGFGGFFETVGAVLMGGRTYRQVRRELSPDTWPYRGKQVYVLTRQAEADAPEGVRVVAGDVPDLLRRLKAQTDGIVWVCGGADVVEQALPEIEEFRLTVMPTLLGDGIPLFRPGGTRISLALNALRRENGVVDCAYTRKQIDK